MSRPANVDVRLLGGRVRARVHRRSATVSGAIILTAVVVGMFALGSGDYPLNPLEVLQTLFGTGPPGADFVVETLRLPRAINALLVGAGLGMAGAIFQSITRNPLGSPDIVGFTWGSATGAVLVIMVVGQGTAAVAGGALAGGIVTAAIVYLIAWGGGHAGYRLILVGIGMSALLAAINTYLIARAPLDTAQAARVWLTGSLNGRGWEYVWPLTGALVVLVPIAAALIPRLRMMELGDDAATALGLRVERSRLALIAVAVALTAVATATAGPIAFVALAAPQIARRVARASTPGLGASALMGALLLAAGDVIAQRVMPGAELPVGVVTGALGGLYLLWLLWHEWRTGGRV